MKTFAKSVTLAVLLSTGTAQAATTVPCGMGPSFWDGDCYYGLSSSANNNPNPNPTEPNPVDPNPADPNPVNPPLPNEAPVLDPSGAGDNIFEGGFQTSEFFFVAPPAADFPNFTPSSTPPSPPSTIPLPASAWLLGTALFGLVSVARRRRGQQLIIVEPR